MVAYKERIIVQVEYDKFVIFPWQLYNSQACLFSVLMIEGFVDLKLATSSSVIIEVIITFYVSVNHKT